ncbi:DNA-protecting protein DprA [Agrobacterium vitis]|uniref:DNA-processing protein DprA n=1 Tax=Agrobacterium vitis TaxID=373 RepID=UPI0012E8DA8B|nr:DNA-processing protein DprA [Agrobacterium vitis]MVA70509.1 DNA-protecting protein DprA [Agrobacterium vitis]
MSAGGSGRSGIALTEKQRTAWLRLIRSDNVGPATFRDLINNFGTAERALDMLPELSQRGGATRSIRIATVAEAERELEFARKFGARFVGIGEPDYPPALRQIDAAPPILAMKGQGSTAIRPSIGIVGSRNASISGVKMAAMLARDCGTTGYTITSGLARGIDAGAHRASLDTGTMAALAGGLDRPYPPENVDLLKDIWDGKGVAVSEMPFGWEPRARDFPRRNRLIAGTSLGVVVIEAASRSGSLITARLAADFGRLVFAVPGSPLDPRCHGTNGLLKNGATITTEARDILEALSPLSSIDLFSQPQVEEPVYEESETFNQPPGEQDRSRIIDALGITPVEVDDIIRHTQLPPSAVYLVMLELDIAGRLHRHPGGLVSIAALD